MPVVERIKNWYGKYERPISSLSLIGGFVFDALTLKRVDLFWENFWVIAHLVIVGTCIVLVHAIEKNESLSTGGGSMEAAANPSKVHFWLVNILQFFFGGILSTYLVFYFRSSDIAVSWPFLLILALCFWANEALKRHFVRLIFQISLFYLSLFAFDIFLIPVIFHKIGSLMFIVSGIVSLVQIVLFLLIVKHFSKTEFEKSKIMLAACIGGIFVLINAFYFTGLIPPIPLCLKEAGVYYNVHRSSSGDYLLTGEQGNWANYFTFYPNFHVLPGEPVFIYSAIFSPDKLNISVVHEWQYLNAKTGKWVTSSRVPLTVVGGRDGGFRTYSEKKLGITEGHWRVNVLTTTNQLIGRIRFNVIFADALPKVSEKIAN